MELPIFEIRPARMADYPALVSLMEADFDVHRAAVPHLFRNGRHVNYDEERFQTLLNGVESCVWVATQGNEVLGLAAAIVREAPETLVSQSRRYTEIDYVSVKEAVRRNGIGRALVKACIDWARAQGTISVALTVFDFNASALNFYRSMGFSTASHRMTLDTQR